MTGVDRPEEHFQRYLEELRAGEVTSVAAFLKTVEPEFQVRVKQRIREVEEIASALLEANDRLHPGAIFAERYELVRLLGSGSAGVVWEAFDREIERRVALKILHPVLGLDSPAEERMKREAKAMAQVKHPGAVKVYEILVLTGRIGLVTELVGDGATLADRILRGGPANSIGEVRERVLSFLPPLQALADAHALGVLHRDIKPTNLVWSGVALKLGDFGLAQAEWWEELTMSGELLGTTPYAAPEQILGKALTSSADVWSAGVTLYEFIFGERLFQGQTISAIKGAIVRGDFRFHRDFRRLPRDLHAVLQKAISLQPEHRYPNAGEFASDLQAWTLGMPVSARTPSRSTRVLRWVSRNPWPSSLILFLSAAVLIVLSALVEMSRARERNLELFSSSQELLRTLDPLLPTARGDTLSRQLERLIEMAESAESLPRKERASFFETLAGAQMALDNFVEAQASLEDALRLGAGDMARVKLGWCLRYSDHDRAQEILEPIAQRTLSGDAESNFVTLFARNRLATLLLDGEEDAEPSRAAQIFNEVANELEGREQVEPWLVPMNLLNLATAYYQLDEYDEALLGLARAENAFVDGGLGMHQELFYVYVARHHIYKSMGQHEDAILAARAALTHRRRSMGANQATTLNMQRLVVQNLIASNQLVEAEAEFLDFLERVPRMEGSAFALEMLKSTLEFSAILGLSADERVQEAQSTFDRLLDGR